MDDWNEKKDKDQEEGRIHSVNPDYVFDRLDQPKEGAAEPETELSTQTDSENKEKAQEPEQPMVQLRMTEEDANRRDLNRNAYIDRKPAASTGKQAVVGILLSTLVFALLIGGLWLLSQKFGGPVDNKNNGSGDNVAAGTTQEATTTPTEAPSKNNVTLTKGEIGTTGNVSATLLDVSPVVDNVFSSVVAVTNKTIYKSKYDFWGQGSQEAQGAGSGIIIAKNEAELLIVSNAHVVLPSNYQNYSVSSCEITVKFANDIEVAAYVKGTDEQMDLAVIAVALSEVDDKLLSEIKIAAIGDSDQIKVGNGVIAIGNALGFGLSVTVGYVSALNREITFSDGTSRILLQTDAAINPGNSGGGLFDIYGRLIGINSAKYSDESVEGIGYAIPISSAQSRIEELMNMEPRKKVTDDNKKCAMGVALESQFQSLYEGKGAFISSVTEDGPAAKAGLMMYDIITEINGVKITSWDDMKEELSYYEGGEVITVKYLTLDTHRRYVEKTTEVTLGFAKDIIKE